MSTQVKKKKKMIATTFLCCVAVIAVTGGWVGLLLFIRYLSVGGKGGVLRCSRRAITIGLWFRFGAEHSPGLNSKRLH